MIIIRILCHVAMFSSYIGNIIFLIKKLIDLPKGLRTLEKDCENLSQFEVFQLHQKRFTTQFLKLLLFSLAFLLIGILTAIFDGIGTEAEIPLLAATFTCTIVYSSLFIFFFVYTSVIRKKYHIVMATQKDLPWNRGTPTYALLALCSLIALVFAFNSAIVTYPIAFLLMY